jgi:hypoxanthine phosphoribosyltransferase
MEWTYKIGHNPSTRKKERMMLYTYENYCEGIKSLYTQISSSHRPDYLCGIYRGGLVPAVHLSYKLNIPLLTLNRRDPKSATAIREYLTSPRSSVIMVDEIIDSGETVRFVNSLFDRDFKWASLVFNTMLSDEISPFYHATIDRTKTSEYVIFHWDND